MNIIIILSIIIIVLFFIIGFTNIPSSSTIFKNENMEMGNCPDNTWPTTFGSSDNSDAAISTSLEESNTNDLLSSYCTIKIRYTLATPPEMTDEDNIYDPFVNSSSEEKEKIDNLEYAINTARWWVDQVFFEKSPGFFIEKKEKETEGYYYSINIFKTNKIGESDNPQFLGKSTVSTFLKQKF